MQIPWPTKIYDCHNGCEVECRVTPLTAETAQERIDLTWWHGVDGRDGEVDFGWEWFGYIRKKRRSQKFRFHAIRTLDHAVQGAVILETNIRTPNYPAGVLVRNLAVAPINRWALVGASQKFRGCGTKLVAFSALVSYMMGADGVLVGFPLEKAVGFYEKLGFVPTEVCDGASKLRLFELPPERAMRLMEEHGALE